MDRITNDRYSSRSDWRKYNFLKEYREMKSLIAKRHPLRTQKELLKDILKDVEAKERSSILKYFPQIMHYVRSD